MNLGQKNPRISTDNEDIDFEQLSPHMSSSVDVSVPAES